MCVVEMRILRWLSGKSLKNRIKDENIKVEFETTPKKIK